MPYITRAYFFRSKQKGAGVILLETIIGDVTQVIKLFLKAVGEAKSGILKGNEYYLKKTRKLEKKCNSSY
ncbi:MAG: hypothetical protein GY750_15075 [Lentisphaerae bacterium]|nr:hypothetical protein [Lentisphaerota bacterium]MCP4102721.1 hypothetical protein [Lentisphaerota bacterium]